MKVSHRAPADQPAARSPRGAVTRAHVAVLLAILALAVALRLLAWSRAVVMMNDGVDFLWQAEQLAAGDWTSALLHPYHPLYALLTAAVGVLTPQLVQAALAVSILGALLVVLASWGLARTALPGLPAVALCAALVAATNARLVPLSADVQSDGLFVGLAMCSVWAVAAAARSASRASRSALPALGGALTGLAYLTRPEALALALPALLVLTVPWVGAAPPGPSVRRAAAYLLGLATCVLPYVFGLQALTDTWGLSLKPSLQFAGLRDAETFHQAPAGSPLSWSFVPRRPRAAAALREARAAGEDHTTHATVIKAEAKAKAADTTQTPDGTAASPAPASPPLTLHTRPRDGWLEASWRSTILLLETLRVELLLLLLPGLLALARRPGSGLLRGTALIVVTWLAVATVQVRVNDYLTNRHLLLAVVAVFPLAGVGLVSLWRGPGLEPAVPGAAAGVSWPRRVARGVAILAVLAAAEQGTHHRRKSDRPRLAALAWVREHTTPDQAFATHRRRDSHYAQRSALPTRMPCNEALLVKRLDAADVPYMVFDLDQVQDSHPHWFGQGLVHEVARFEGKGDTVVVLEPRFAAQNR